MNIEKLRDTEYKICSGLLAELIEADADTKEKIYQCWQSMGIRNFFLHLELLEFSGEIAEKLINIRSVIKMLEEERGKV